MENENFDEVVTTSKPEDCIELNDQQDISCKRIVYLVVIIFFVNLNYKIIYLLSFKYSGFH